MTDPIHSIKPLTATQARRLFLNAIKDGDIDKVEAMLPLVDPKENRSEALRWAAEHQHPRLVELLIPVSEPGAWDSLALRWACEKPGFECFELLLPHSNPKDEKSAALRLAVTYGNIDAARVLFPLSDVEAAYKELLPRAHLYPGSLERFEQMWEEHKANELNAVLSSEVGAGAAAPKRKL